MERIEDILQDVAERIVDKPDEVRCDVVQSSGGTTVYSLHVAEEDRGKIIGRQGKTAQSLRQLMVAFMGKDRSHYVLEIVQG